MQENDSTLKFSFAVMLATKPSLILGWAQPPGSWSQTRSPSVVSCSPVSPCCTGWLCCPADEDFLKYKCHIALFSNQTLSCSCSASCQAQGHLKSQPWCLSLLFCCGHQSCGAGAAGRDGSMQAHVVGSGDQTSHVKNEQCVCLCEIWHFWKKWERWASISLYLDHFPGLGRSECLLNSWTVSVSH